MAKRRGSRAAQSAWRQEINDLIRGASGGFLFGIPLMYTMEVWWIGSYTDPPVLLAVLITTFVVILLLNRTDGFRRFSTDEVEDVLPDSIETLAIGIICTTCTLALLGEVTLETPLQEILGKVIFEGVPFSIGVALASSILSGNPQAGSKQQQEAPTSDQHRQDDRPDPRPDDHQPQQHSRKEPSNDAINPQAIAADVGATLIGAIFVAFSIAPTDEVPMLTAAVSPPGLLALIAASLLISYGIVFQAGFTTQQKRVEQTGLFQHPLVETIVSYLLGLIAATLMLWFFHRLTLTDPWDLWLRQAIILGLPAAVGGAAGRLAV